MLALLLAGAAAISYEIWRFRKEIVPDLSAQAEIIGDNSAAALVFNDRTSGKEVLTTLHARKEIVFAGLYTPEWKLFAQYAPGTPVNMAWLRLVAHVGHHFEDSKLILFREVKLDEEIVGHICLVADLSDQYARVRTYCYIALGILVGLAVLSIFFSSRLQRLVSEPILQLAGVARDVTERKDYSLRAAKQSRDEVGVLTDAFNEMLGRIQDRELRLERRTAELQEANEALQTLIQTSPLAINVLDLEGKVTLWNTAAEQMFGWTEQEVKGTFLPIISEEQRPEFTKLLKEVLQLQPLGGREVRRRRKDGSPIDISLFTSPLRDAKGNITGTMGVIEDITERKRIEQRTAAQHSVTRVLAESQSFNEATPKLLQALCEHLGWEMGATWKLTPATDQLFCTGTWHPPGFEAGELEKACRELRFEKGVGMPGTAWATRKPAWMADMGQDATFLRGRVAGKLGIHGAIAFPCVASGHLVSVIELFSREVRDPDPALLDLFGTLGSQIGQFVERRRAQLQLRESEERFRQMADNIHEVFWMTDVAKNQMLYISPGYEDVWGRTCESLYKSPREWLDAIHPEDRPRVLKDALSKQVDGKYDEEYRIIRPDGSMRWIHDRAYPIRDPSGAVYRVAGIAEDISTRRMAEVALREAEEKWRSLVDNSREIVIILDRHGTIEYINRVVPGFSRNAVLGTTTYDYMPDEEHPRVREVLNRVFDRGEPEHIELKGYGAHGGLAWYETRYVPIKREGQVVSVLLLSTDITERKEAEKTLRFQSEIARNMEEGVNLVRASDARIIYANPKFERMLGYEPGELKDQPVSILNAPTDKPPEEAAREIIAVLERDGAWSGEIRNRRKDGTFIWCSANVSAFEHPDYGTVWVAVHTDITERKRAEEALRESEERLKAVLDNSPAVVQVKDLFGRYLLVNRRWEDLLQRPANEVAGKTPYDFFPKQTAEALLAGDRKVLEAGSPLEFEEVLPLGNENRIYAASKFPLRDANGVAYAVCGISFDITERRRAQQALKETQERLEAIMNNTTAVIYVKDLDGRYLLINHSFETLFHLRREEVLGKTDLDIFPTEQAESFRANDRRVLEQRLPVQFEEIALQDDGPHTYVSNKFPLFDATGVPYAVCGISTDITQRKRAEEAVREAEEKYRSIFENVVDGIYQTTPEGRFLTANPALARMLGYATPEELIATVTDVERQLYVEPARRAELKRLLEERGVVQGFEVEMRCKNGSRIWVSLSVRIVRRHNGTSDRYEGIAEDITERKRAEEQLRQAHSDLQRSLEQLKSTQLQLIQAAKMESIGKLATGVAHEVKNPLAIASMGLEYLTGSLNQKDPEAASVLRDIKEALERADLVVHGLLDFSTPTTLDLRVVDLNGIIAHTLSLVRHELGKKHITLVRELADDLPETKLDENKTQQVVLNICMNSIHAMPGGGQLRVKTRRDLSPAGQTLVVIEVEDTGPGIPADKLAKVFDPFFSTKSFGKGHGLGLSIAKQIVELHRGTIELRNRPEGGVKVTMAFPQ
jgi:hypothetical protein